MTAKAAGICLIVLSSFGLGLIKSVELQKRYRLLKEWEKIVLLLEQEISCHIPLPEAYHRVGDRVCDPFKPFLKVFQNSWTPMEGNLFGNFHPGGQALSGRRMFNGGGSAPDLRAGGSCGFCRPKDAKKSAGQVPKRAGNPSGTAGGTAAGKAKTVPQSGNSGRGISGNFAALTKGGEKLEVSIIFKIGAVGILVSVLSQVLKHSGREEQAFLASLAGLVIVLFWILPYINELFESVRQLFML